MIVVKTLEEAKNFFFFASLYEDEKVQCVKNADGDISTIEKKECASYIEAEEFFNKK